MTFGVTLAVKPEAVTSLTSKSGAAIVLSATTSGVVKVNSTNIEAVYDVLFFTGIYHITYSVAGLRLPSASPSGNPLTGPSYLTSVTEVRFPALRSSSISSLPTASQRSFSIKPP